ncbi:addiction module component [Oceanimonas sp. CHS3-5]|uniref:addiction module component n=1 Tax=Oceanimonas sp. CHS3-5 TaxID=3068186 RepID=UPI00273D4112|nr:addiction module component [Oceanimonas sp. CHS3-5]MDP5291066.1 addiction module component [Oceanimonas sp. CHS3-5]
MKQLLLTLLAAGFVTGCASERHYGFDMGQDTKALDSLQVLDPGAGARSDGKLADLTLNGEYGVSLHGKYVKGAESPSEGKTQVTLNFGE